MARLTIQYQCLFGLLFLGFFGVGVMVWDLKHPSTQHDQCFLVGQGAILSAFKDSATLLYSRSGRPEEDIGFHCHSLDNVVINDSLMLSINQKQPIELVIKRYHWMPTQYLFRIPVHRG